MKVEKQETLGQWIEKRIDVLGLSRAEAAVRADITADGLRRIIQGKSLKPQPDTLRNLATALEVDYVRLRNVRDGQWTSPEDMSRIGSVQEHPVMQRLRDVAAIRHESLEYVADQVIKVLDILEPRARGQ